uniref:Uncharacterized protein n=1 Tax=Anguilla anguilla TaxID=7936 RepID=A0A0E9UEK9_ANGAN
MKQYHCGCGEDGLCIDSFVLNSATVNNVKKVYKSNKMYISIQFMLESTCCNLQTQLATFSHASGLGIWH